MNATTYIVETSLRAGMREQETEFTIDWAGISPEQERELAARTLRIKRQGIWRREGIIPKQEKILAVDHVFGTRMPRKTAPTIDNTEQMFRALSPEQQQAVLARITNKS